MYLKCKNVHSIIVWSGEIDRYLASGLEKLKRLTKIYIDKPTVKTNKFLIFVYLHSSIFCKYHSKLSFCYFSEMTISYTSSIIISVWLENVQQLEYFIFLQYAIRFSHTQVHIFQSYIFLFC